MKYTLFILIFSIHAHAKSDLAHRFCVKAAQEYAKRNLIEETGGHALLARRHQKRGDYYFDKAIAVDREINEAKLEGYCDAEML